MRFPAREPAASGTWALAPSHPTGRRVWRVGLLQTRGWAPSPPAPLPVTPSSPSPPRSPPSTFQTASRERLLQCRPAVSSLPVAGRGGTSSRPETAFPHSAADPLLAPTVHTARLSRGLNLCSWTVSPSPLCLANSHSFLTTTPKRQPPLTFFSPE